MNLTTSLPLLEQKAEDHFAFILQSPRLAGLSMDTATEFVRLARLALSEALALKVGELLPLTKLMADEAPQDSAKALLLRGLPFISGALGLLEMEFAHDVAGVLPPDTVRELLQAENPVDFAGEMLTVSNVFVQYRRVGIFQEVRSDAR